MISEIPQLNQDDTKNQMRELADRVTESLTGDHSESRMLASD